MYLKKELRLNAGVLIDTWWNVNNILNLRFQCIKVVLIDTCVAGDIAGCAETLSEAERERAGQGASEVWFRTVGHHHQPPPRHLPPGNGGCPPRAYHRQEPYRGRDGAEGKPCAETCPDRQGTGHLSGRRAGRQDMG